MTSPKARSWRRTRAKRYGMPRDGWSEAQSAGCRSRGAATASTESGSGPGWFWSTRFGAEYFGRVREMGVGVAEVFGAPPDS
jgi:hypothetical protein